MIVTRHELIEAFDDLIAGNRSREAIADLAKTAMMADDVGKLILEPETEAKKLWETIIYLSGVDIMDSPDVYLHTIDDFQAYRRKVDL